MTNFGYILLVIGAIMLLKKQKGQKMKYPTNTYASPYFKWKELIVSRSQPAIALEYRKLYPEGNWPMITDPGIWNINDGRLARLKRIASSYIIETPINKIMVDHLNNLVEPLRKALGDRPFTIISGWRPPELNQAVDGAELSGHMLGVATDILADRATREAAREWAIQRQKTHGDIGFYKNYATFFHIGSPRGYNDGIIK